MTWKVTKNYNKIGNKLLIVKNKYKINILKQRIINLNLQK